MLIDGQEISPEYEKALKDVQEALEKRHTPGGAARYRQAVAHAVSVKQKEKPMNLAEARAARQAAQDSLRVAVLGAHEAQKSANEIMAAYQDDPRASIRMRWEKAMARVANCDETVGLYVRALDKAEKDLAQAKSAAGPETYTVGQIEAAYNRYYDRNAEAPGLASLIETLRSLP